MKCNQPSAATLGSAILGMMGHKFLNGHNYTSVAITDHEWSSSAHCTDMQALCDHVKQCNGEFNAMTTPYESKKTIDIMNGHFNNST